MTLGLTNALAAALLVVSYFLAAGVVSSPQTVLQPNPLNGPIHILTQER